MTTTSAVPSAALATILPVFTHAERVALAGFLAGYRGLTREGYALDLRQFTPWCRARSLALSAVRRADIESLDLEARGPGPRHGHPAAVPIAGFNKYAVEDDLLGTSSQPTSLAPPGNPSGPANPPPGRRGRQAAARDRGKLRTANSA